MPGQSPVFRNIPACFPHSFPFPFFIPPPSKVKRGGICPKTRSIFQICSDLLTFHQIQTYLCRTHIKTLLLCTGILTKICKQGKIRKNIPSPETFGRCSEHLIFSDLNFVQKKLCVTLRKLCVTLRLKSARQNDKNILSIGIHQRNKNEGNRNILPGFKKSNGYGHTYSGPAQSCFC